MFKRSHRKIEERLAEAARRTNDLERRLARNEGRQRALEEILGVAAGEGLEQLIESRRLSFARDHVHPHNGRGELVRKGT